MNERPRTDPSAHDDRDHGPDRLEIAWMRPIQVSIRHAGPFRKAEGFKVSFLGPHPEGPPLRSEIGDDGSSEKQDPIETLRRATRPPPLPAGGDRARKLCNLWILQAEGALGKTTFVDTLRSLFDLLGTRPRERFARPSRSNGEIAAGETAQLDLLVRLVVGEVGRNVVLSLWFGAQDAPADWQPLLDADGAWKAHDWARIAFDGKSWTPARGTNELGSLILRALHRREGAAMRSRSAVEVMDGAVHSFRGRPRALPTCICFGANRPLDEPLSMPPPAFLPGGYAPLRNFAFETGHDAGFEDDLRRQQASDPQRFDEVLQQLDDIVFAGAPRLGQLLRRNADAADGHRQPLDELGRAERALLSLHACTLLNMTEATLLLVDDLDQHFEPGRYKSVLASLERLAQRFPAVCIVATARDPAFLDAYDFKTQGHHLVKGGEVLTPERIR